MESGEADGLSALTIDLDAVASNWRLLAARAAPGECGAAVKADAYGCGIEAVVPALARAGCRAFFVAHVSEGRRCRQALRGVGAEGRIFVLNGFHREAAPFDEYVLSDLSAVVGSLEELKTWEADRQRAGRDRRCALHVDTGMNRLGFPVEEALALSAERLEAAGVDLLMSHLVAAEQPEEPVTARQIASFGALRRSPLGRLPASLSNSSGLFLPGKLAFDLARPGYALYGGNPTPGHANPMRSVVGLVLRILQVRHVPAGAAAGYNARWTAPRPSRLATLPIGYADGLPMGASGLGGSGAPVYLGDHPCPIVGRISMDLTIVDVTDAPDARPGMMVEVLGPHVSIDDLAASAGTIGYQVLTGLGRRYRRHYLGGDAAGSACPTPGRTAVPA